MSGINTQPVTGTSIPATQVPSSSPQINAPRTTFDISVEVARTSDSPVEAGKALRDLDAMTGDKQQTNQIVQGGSGPTPVSEPTTNPADGGWVNPTGGSIRSDAGGDGHYGAARSRRGGVHYGVDYSGVAGQAVYAPISGTITPNRANGSSVLGGFSIVSDDQRTRVTVLYAPLNAGLSGTRVTAGQAVATQADLQTFNPGKGRSEYPANVGDHVHLQATVDGKRVDPTGFVTVFAGQ